MILNAVAGKPLPIYGDGLQVRDWLFVEDHCEALRLVLRNGTPGETYNIGGNCERTNLAVVNQICSLVDELCPASDGRSAKSLMERVRDRPGHDRRYAIDAAKMRQELGWTPTHDFESGLRMTVAWYLDNAEWIESVASNKYRGERLGLKAA
jgi:dTDP-glucose 4,6-dehydratase